MEEAERLRDRGAELGDPTGGRILGGIGWCLSYHNPLNIFEQLGALGLSPSAAPVIVTQKPLRQDGRYQLVEFRTPSGTSTGVLDTKGSLFGGLIPVTMAEQKALEKGELTPQGVAAGRSVEPPVPAGSCIVYRGERSGEWIAYGPDMRRLDVTIIAASEAEARAKANEWFRRNNPDLAEEIYAHPEFEIQREPEEDGLHDAVRLLGYETTTHQKDLYEIFVEPVRAFEAYRPVFGEENRPRLDIRLRDFMNAFEEDYLAPILAVPYVACKPSENGIHVTRLPFKHVESSEVTNRVRAHQVLEKRISREDLELFSDRWHNRTNCVFPSSFFAGKDALVWGRMTEDFVASNGRVVHEITTSEETAIEGKALKHCVKAAGYDRACARDGLTRLYSLPVDGVPNSTVELKIIKADATGRESSGFDYISKPLGPKKDFRLGIVQHQAYMDGEPSPEAKAALREWMDAVESGKLKLNIGSINDVKQKLAEIEVENSDPKVDYGNGFEYLAWSEAGVVPTPEWEQQATDFIKRNWVIEKGVETRFERVMPDGSVITATITGKDDKGQNVYRWADASGLHVDDHVAQTAVTTRVVRTRNLLSFFEGPGTQSIIQEATGAVGMNSKTLRVTNPNEAPVFQYPIEKFSDIGKYDQ